MTTPSLVGRSGELGVLADLIDQSADHGSAIVVLGEPGIGKSSLLHAAAARARCAGLQVLEITGVESETRLPFAGLHQLLRPILAATDQLSLTQRRALLSAFGIEDGPPPEPFLIALAALNLLTEAASGRAVAVVADDIQWLDQATHEALAFIARRIERDPIVVIAAARVGYDMPFLMSGLRELTVVGLDDAASQAVLASHAADLDSAGQARILREALGNPLALVELPAALRTRQRFGTEIQPDFIPLTDRLERAFASRIRELPTLTRDAVLVVAVDDEDELPEIISATGVLAGRDVGVDVLDGAAGAGLLRFDEQRVRLRHPLVRSGILQAESPRRRQQANAALAAVLADQPYRRTWHRAHAIVGPDDDVADELETSHLVALRSGSVDSAIWALERSAQLTADSATRGRRLLLAAEHAFGLGRADIVDQLLAAAQRTALSNLDRARMEWLREIFNDGVPGDAVRVFEMCDVASRSALAGDNDLALNLLLGAALRCWWADAGEQARGRVVSVTEQVRAAENDARYVAALALAEPVSRARAVDELLGRVVLETVTDANALRLLGMAAHAIGDPVRSVDFLDRAETRMREQGRLALLSHVLTMQILDRLELGDWQRAAAAVEEGQRVAHQTGQPIWDTGTLVLGAITVALRGDNEKAQSIAAEAEQAAGGRGLNDLLACVQLARGFGWVTSGHYAEAYHALRRLFDPDDICHHATERFHGIAFLAEAAIHAGRVDDARRVLRALERDARTTPAATLHVHLAYARAVLADDEHAEKLFRAALGADLMRWPWAKARLELAYGSWLRRQRRVAESRMPLRSAQTTFDLIGAGWWAGQARAELRAAGERVRLQGPTAQDTLSAQELQIAHLAAEGLSNRQIGQRLYLSPRTVGSHLYRIFPKLDITSRAQLGPRLDLV